MMQKYFDRNLQKVLKTTFTSLLNVCLKKLLRSTLDTSSFHTVVLPNAFFLHILHNGRLKMRKNYNSKLCICLNNVLQLSKKQKRA